MPVVLVSAQAQTTRAVCPVYNNEKKEMFKLKKEIYNKNKERRRNCIRRRSKKRENQEASRLLLHSHLCVAFQKRVNDLRTTLGIFYCLALAIFLALACIFLARASIMLARASIDMPPQSILVVAKLGGHEAGHEAGDLEAGDSGREAVLVAEDGRHQRLVHPQRQHLP